MKISCNTQSSYFFQISSLERTFKMHENDFNSGYGKLERTYCQEKRQNNGKIPEVFL